MGVEYKTIWIEDLTDAQRAAFGFNHTQYDYGYALVRFDGDEATFIAHDGGEPEDQTFGRDWSWVAPLLNEHVAEAARLRAENVALLARAEEAERERDAAVASLRDAWAEVSTVDCDMRTLHDIISAGLREHAKGAKS